MQITGTSDFGAGQTLKKRVSISEPRILAKCSGYRADEGTLQPEDLSAAIDITTPIEAGGLPLSNQSPMVFTRNGVTSIITRDKNTKLRMETGGAWSAAGGACSIVAEAAPPRLRDDQIIYATKGTDPKLMVFEPAAFTAGKDSLRPLSFKGPLDYLDSEKPVVTPSASPAVRLFDCDDAEADWAAVGTGVTCTTSGDSVVIALTSTTPANAVLAKKDLGATGVSPSAKSFLVLDIAVENDAQNYTYSGLFPNDPLMAPSGYTLELYSDQACTALIKSFYIPKCTQQGSVYRIAINIGALSTTIKGVGLRSAAFWTAPTTGVTYNIRLWSEAFKDDWTHKGNFLMPAVQWNKGAWADILSETAEGTSGYLDLPPTGNLLPNGGFESAGSWTVSNASYQKRDAVAARSGGYGFFTHCDDASTWTITSADCPVDAGREYKFDIWYRAFDNGGNHAQWKIEVKHYNVGVLLRTDTWPAAGYYAPFETSDWQSFKTQFSTPANTTKCVVTITIPKRSGGGLAFYFDDIAIYPANQASTNCAYVLQTFSQGGTDFKPSRPLVEYVYSFLGKDRLSVQLYNHMVSNPSWASAPSAFADPWRTYAVAITLPSDGTNTVVSEYGGYVTHALIYRRIYDGETETWGDYKFIQAVDIASSMAYTDAGDDADPLVGDVSVPDVLEANNDYLASARYACYQGRRVRAFTLNWSETDGEWKYRLGEAISSDGKPWAFPTGLTDEPLVTDGVWTEVEAVTGSEIRGCIATTDDVYVFLDNEFFIERGRDPISGYRHIRVDSVGLESERSLANCRGVPIGLAPDRYFYTYLPGMVQPISKGVIDGSLIDLTKPHDAVFCKDRYIFLCEYDGAMAMLIYNLTGKDWRVRTSTLFASWVGMVTDGIKVYGLDSTGAIYDAFGSAYGAGVEGDNVRNVDTQFIQVASPGTDVQVTGLMVELSNGVTDESIALTAQGIGLKNTEVLSRTLTIKGDVTRYHINCSFLAEAVKVTATYTGYNPPDITFLGITHDTETVR